MSSNTDELNRLTKLKTDTVKKSPSLNDVVMPDDIDMKEFSDGDTLILKPHQKAILQKCCGCGLWHEITISDRRADLRLTITRLEGEPNWDDYEVRTHVDRKKA